MDHPQEDTRKGKKRILVADDNPVNQKMAATYLKRLGYDVESTANGLEAVEKYTSSPHSIALILMDIQMPWTDGLRAAKTIREFEDRRGLPPIPIIGMSADTDQEDREQCMSAGMNDFLSKPLRIDRITDMLDKWIAPSNIAQDPEPRA